MIDMEPSMRMPEAVVQADALFVPKDSVLVQAVERRIAAWGA
jgi:hypothetical protein